MKEDCLLATHFDLIVIGAGPGGYVAAIKAAQLGKNAAVIEAREVGGACLNRGCIPTKTLLHAAGLVRSMQEAERFGVKAEGVSFDFAAVHNRREEVVTQLRGGVEGLLAANGITLVRGFGVLTAPHEVTVDDTIYTADKILLACGADPARPPIPGLDLPGVCTSDELLTGTPTLPKQMVIIGGGVIGMEFACVYQALGVQVTVIEALERILPTLDREISQNLSMLLKKDGASIFTGARVERLEQAASGLICHFTVKEQLQTAQADCVLVSTGRRAATEHLLGAGVDLALDRGQIPVNDRFETCIGGVYAIGDAIKGGIQLAHVASAQAVNVVCAMFGETPPVSLDAVPACVYTDPEIACVGITADEAKAQGIAVKTGKFIMSANGRSLIEQSPRGFIKVVFDAQTEHLLGAQLMCARASDLISELADAVANRLTAAQLAAVIRPHPSFCEGITEAVEDALGHAVHIAPKKRL